MDVSAEKQPIPRLEMRDIEQVSSKYTSPQELKGFSIILSPCDQVAEMHDRMFYERSYVEDDEEEAGPVPKRCRNDMAQKSFRASFVTE